MGIIVFVEPKTSAYQEQHRFFLGGAVEKHYVVLELLNPSAGKDLPSRVLLGISVYPPRADLCDMDTRLLRLDRWHPGDYVIAFSYEATRLDDGSCSLPWVFLSTGEMIREHPALEPYIELPLYCTMLGDVLLLDQPRTSGALGFANVLGTGSE